MEPARLRTIPRNERSVRLSAKLTLSSQLLAVSKLLLLVNVALGLLLLLFGMSIALVPLALAVVLAPMCCKVCYRVLDKRANSKKRLTYPT